MKLEELYWNKGLLYTIWLDLSYFNIALLLLHNFDRNETSLLEIISSTGYRKGSNLPIEA
jgi:hypothetical protein